MEKILIEASWEVANKVGGIYTVIKSKAPYIQKYFPEEYYLIGPYLPNVSYLEFSPLSIPEIFREPIKEAEALGVKVYYGEWLINSRPKCFLIDYSNFLDKVNTLKYELWANYRIDSLRTGDDYNHPIAWCKASSIFLKILGEKLNAIPKILHLHEWLSGAIVLFENLPYTTIFTTHATVLGRSISGTGVNLWEKLSFMNPDEESYKYGVEAKHKIEKMAANRVNFFTVISNVLKTEAELILGRRPDFILPNGIDIFKFSTIEEITYLHRKNRDLIKDFLLYLFSPYYKVELTKSLFFFISGRMEIRNKGIDIFIRALSELNKKLTEKDPNIFSFIFVPSENLGPDPIILNNLNIYRHLEETIEDLLPEIKSRLIHFLIHQEPIKDETIFERDEFLEIKQIIKQIRPANTPPISTHLLKENNEILVLLKTLNLTNKFEDKVKVIYYPTYLRTGDGFLNLPYEDVISGCHLGVFPSLYEPWGYTPLETALSGVITITSDVTGFSDYLKSIAEFNKDFPGIYFVYRKGKRDAEVVEELANLMLSIARLSRSARIQNKLEARRLASLCSWDNLIKNYLDLYYAAFQRK